MLTHINPSIIVILSALPGEMPRVKIGQQSTHVRHGKVAIDSRI